MPKLFNNFKECLEFSHIIRSAALIVSIALSLISFKLPIGVATMYRPEKYSFIYILFIFIISCTPVNKYNETKKQQINKEKSTDPIITNDREIKLEGTINKEIKIEKTVDVKLNNVVTILFSNEDKVDITNQFTEVIELAVYDKLLSKVNLQIRFFNSKTELQQIISNTKNYKVQSLWLNLAE